MSGLRSVSVSLLPFKDVSSKLPGLLVFDVGCRLCDAWMNCSMGCRLGDLRSGLSVVSGVVFLPFGVDRGLVLLRLLDFDVGR